MTITRQRGEGLLCVCGGHLYVEKTRRRRGYVDRRRACRLCGRRVHTRERVIDPPTKGVVT